MVMVPWISASDNGSSTYFCNNEAVHPGGSTASFSLLKRIDDFAVFSFGKGFQGLGGHVAYRSRGQHEFRARFIVRKLRNNHGVVLSHGQVPGVDLSAGFPELLLTVFVLLHEPITNSKSCILLMEGSDCGVVIVSYKQQPERKGHGSIDQSI
jgi:hypothetical protein